VNDATQIEAVLKTIADTFGEVSILVNNAGITRDTLLMRMKDEDWDAVISTNLTSVYRLSQAVMRPMMKARHGRIISVSSIVGHTGNAGQTNYAAAKAGMSGFTKSLAQELGSRGVTVNCVAPGFIDTDMTRELPEKIKTDLLAKIPMGKLGDVKDIAAAVAFLASPSAGYITGETLHVNGGMYMA
jgi:3-oxoacyl-[acyl-carrier protein] reductase